MMIRFKTFPWADLEFDDIETIESTSPGIPRLYKTPEGKFPSMTSILSVLKDGGLEKWRARVGEEEADRITNGAGARGTVLHEYNEQYLQNKLSRSDMSGQARTLFNRVKPYLDEIELVVATEVALYDAISGYAGRVDCICMTDDKIMITDHKNSRNAININLEWNRKKLFKYMLQTCGYGRALNYMRAIPASHGCMIVGNHLASSADRFIFELDPLEAELDFIVKAYRDRTDAPDSAFYDDEKLKLLFDICNLKND
jgi:genome maintenance exonuclease 1